MIFATANHETAARSVGRVSTTQARRIVEWQATDPHGWTGWARRGEAMRCMAGSRRLGRARHGGARHLTVRQRRLGTTGPCAVRCGNAGEARYGSEGLARRRAEKQRRQGLAYPSPACRGETQTGERGRGINCAQYFYDNYNQTRTR